MSPIAGPLAILSALAEEQEGLIGRLSEPRQVRHAGRDFHSGLLDGVPVLLALSRIGKVAAATTTAALIERFGVRAIVFTGVAGGVGEGVGIGDVVLGSGYVQHDMDASPLFPRYEIPLTGVSVYPADAFWLDCLRQACTQALGGRQYLGRAVCLHQGLIASGDRFVSAAAEQQRLLHGLAAQQLHPLAVEMEGAAVAQACADYGVPFVAVRTISDRADGDAHVDFPQFVASVASRYAQDIVRALLADPRVRSTPARAARAW